MFSKLIIVIKDYNNALAYMMSDILKNVDLNTV